MAYSKHGVPYQELSNRIVKLQTALTNNDVDGALIIQKTDLYYFGSTSQQGWLYVPAHGKPLLMVFKDFDRARKESPLDEIVSISSARKIPEVIAQYGLQQPGILAIKIRISPVFGSVSETTGDLRTLTSRDFRAVPIVCQPAFSVRRAFTGEQHVHCFKWMIPVEYLKLYQAAGGRIHSGLS